MTERIKDGDNVVCVDVGGNIYITKGSKYTVTRVSYDDSLVWLKEVPGFSYHAYRFKKCKKINIRVIE